MGAKNEAYNEWLKAQKRGYEGDFDSYYESYESYSMAGEKQLDQDYTTWDAIASDIYGDPRMAQALMASNPGLNTFTQGTTINAPPKYNDPYVSHDWMADQRGETSGGVPTADYWQSQPVVKTYMDAVASGDQDAINSAAYWLPNKYREYLTGGGGGVGTTAGQGAGQAVQGEYAQTYGTQTWTAESLRAAGIPPSQWGSYLNPQTATGAPGVKDWLLGMPWSEERLRASGIPPSQWQQYLNPTAPPTILNAPGQPFSGVTGSTKYQQSLQPGQIGTNYPYIGPQPLPGGGTYRTPAPPPIEWASDPYTAQPQAQPPPLLQSAPGTYQAQTNELVTAYNGVLAAYPGLSSTSYEEKLAALQKMTEEEIAIIELYDSYMQGQLK